MVYVCTRPTVGACCSASVGQFCPLTHPFSDEVQLHAQSRPVAASEVRALRQAGR
jgi:hypothetical protein